MSEACCGDSRDRGGPSPALAGRRTVYLIRNMDCPTEEALARKGLAALPGIRDLVFDLLERQLTVVHDDSGPGDVVAALRNVGLEAEELAAAGRSSREAEVPALPPHRWALLAVAGLAALAAEGLAWAGHPETSTPVVGLALLSFLTGGIETLRKGWIALRTLTLNINFLMSLAVIGAAAIGSWPEAAMVVFLFGLAESIEVLSIERAKNAVRALMAMAPEIASVRSEAGDWQELPAAAVKIGQTVRVKPGERIPLDGLVTGGGGSVNQAAITGESMPVTKAPGDPVFAGTLNERGALELRVTAEPKDTTLARIVRSIGEAQSQRAPTQRFVDRFAVYYTPAVVVAAALVAALPPLVSGAEFAPWLYRGLVLLVIACPCALVISTPVTVVSGLAAAARRGILIKGGIHLENGAGIRLVALDKTGTITHGRPKVTDVLPLGGLGGDGLLQLAATVDAPSEHPVATAIVAAWKGPLLEISGFEALTGRGAKALVAGKLHYVGNHRLSEELGVCSPQIEEKLQGLERQGKTTVVVSTAEAALGILGVADTPRPTSIEAIRELQALGVRVVMLSGDTEVTARSVAAGVGIEDVRGSLLPEDKVTAIDALMAQYGSVAMVGDGVNDAPALARASIGFAMGAAGTDTAIETADVALMDDDLRKLAEFIRLSRRTGRVLRQNITLALGLKAIFLALAAFGKATLWMAVFADMGASLLVVANGLRLLRPADLTGQVLVSAGGTKV